MAQKDLGGKVLLSINEVFADVAQTVNIMSRSGMWQSIGKNMGSAWLCLA